MITFAKLREGEGTWADRDLRRLDNEPLGYIPQGEWMKVICFDGELTGLYVLTDDDDNYFTCHSILLDFKDTADTNNEMKLAYDRESQDATYTITTQSGITDFIYGNSMYEVYLEAKELYGEGVSLRPSWYDEWECGSQLLATAKGNGCWYDKYGNHYRMQNGKLVG